MFWGSIFCHPSLSSKGEKYCDYKMIFKETFIWLYVNICYSLDLQFPQKFHVLKALLLACVVLESGGTFRKWDLVEGSWFIGCLWKGYWTLATSCLCLYFLATMRWTDIIHHALSIWCTVLLQIQNIRAKYLWTETSGTMSKNKSFLLSSWLC
jgi:hypothetical protein